MITKNDIGKKIRTARQEKGLSQGQLGSSLEPVRSHAAISDIERGITAVTITDLSVIASKLEKPLSYFTGSVPRTSMTNMRTAKDITPDEYNEGKKSIDDFYKFVDSMNMED